MNGYDTEANAEAFASMLAYGDAPACDQAEPAHVPAAPPAPQTRIVRPEDGPHVGSPAAEDFARMVAPLF